METQVRSGWDRARGGLLGLLVGVVLGAVVAGLVYVDARDRLEQRDTTYAEDVAALKRVEAESRTALDGARATEALLRARVSADHALDEADASNYGLARDALRTVASSLSQVDPTLTGVDPAALTETRRLVDAAMAEVAPNPQALRARLVEVEVAVDRLLPREPQG